MCEIGLGSAAGDLFISSRVSHYAAPLYSSFVPPLNLSSVEGRDFYRHCLGDPPADVRSSRMDERGVRSSTKRQRNDNGLPIETWMDVAESNEKHFGSSTRAVLQNWICAVRADTAARNGLRNLVTCHILT